jgi:hypothetical protein
MLWIKINFYRLISLVENIKNICDFYRVIHLKFLSVIERIRFSFFTFFENLSLNHFSLKLFSPSLPEASFKGEGVWWSMSLQLSTVSSYGNLLISWQLPTIMQSTCTYVEEVKWRRSSIITKEVQLSKEPSPRSSLAVLVVVYRVV